MTKDFTTKKELFKFLRDKCGDVLDDFIVVDVRANVLREIYDDREKTDKEWGEFMRRQEKIEEELKSIINKLEEKVKAITMILNSLLLRKQFI